MPLVSITIPVYNGEKYLHRSIKSLINQTLKDIEIIVVNDGSTDNTLQILEEYSSKDSRIKILNFENNKGLYEARLSGFEKATSDYIASCDADDYYSLDAMEKMYKKAIETNADIVQGKMLVVYNDLNSADESGFNRISYKFLENDKILSFVMNEGMNWSMCAKLIKKSIFIKSLSDYPRDEHLITTEDLMIFAPIAYYSKKQVSINFDTYFYNRSSEVSSQVMGNLTKDIKRFNDIFNIGNKITDFLKSKNLFDRYKDVHYKRIERDFFYYFNDFNYSVEERTKQLNKYLNFDSDMLSYVERYTFTNLDLIKNVNIDEIDIFKKNEITRIKTIAMYIPILNTGGAERVVSILSFLFESKNYKVIIFTDEDRSEKDYTIPDNVARITLPADIKTRYETWKSSIEKHKIDLIIYNAFWSNHIEYDCLFIKELCVKNVIVLHSAFTIMTKNKSFFYKVINCFRLFDCIVTLSSTDIYFYNCFGINNVVYIPNPLTFSIENSKQASLDSKIILWLSRFLPSAKKPEFALAAFAKVLKKVPDAIFLMVGSGWGYENDIVHDKIKELGISKNCDLVGFQTDVVPYILKSSVHIITSKYEGYPMSIGECKAHGLPTVMFDLPYLEMTKNNLGVVKVTQGDTDALADALIKVLTDDEYRKKLGREARESLANFTNDRVIEEWLKLFDKIEKNTVENISVDPEAKIVINEFINFLETREPIASNEHQIVHQAIREDISQELMPYFFYIIKDSKYLTIHLFGLKITIKNKKEYYKYKIITLNTILRRIFLIHKDKENNMLKINFLFFKIGIKIKK